MANAIVERISLSVGSAVASSARLVTDEALRRTASAAGSAQEFEAQLHSDDDALAMLTLTNAEFSCGQSAAQRCFTSGYRTAIPGRR
jgi:hypothetical protein